MLMAPAGAGVVAMKGATGTVSTTVGRADLAHERGGKSRANDAGSVVTDKTVLDQMVEGLNSALQAVDRRLQFLVHETTGRIYVKVIDRETDEVIREIPPEQILDLVGRIHEMVGLLIDETV